MDRPVAEPLRILCIGAHSDDIEIGCCATLSSLFALQESPRVYWTVFSALGDREEEALDSASRLLEGVDESTVEALGFRDGYFPSEVAGIKEHFEGIKARFDPHLIFTHWERDRHQDHRVVSELTWNTFRDHLILEYEIPKYDGDLGQPNVFCPVSTEARDVKIQHLMGSFATQRRKAWYNSETFNGLMRIRGMEGASPTGYAEAFFARKLRLGV
jgi:LmbE family N-acetylglucosaminyl deacetylase